MILPLGTDRPRKRPTLVNHALIGLNLLAFIVTLVAERAAQPGSSPIDPFLLDPTHLRWWPFITYQFLHAGALHLGGNMLFLWTFGPNVEDRLGRIGYLAFYLLGGAAAGGMHAVFSSHPVLGASGSIAAVVGAYLVLFPRTLIKVFFLFFFIGVYQIPAAWFLGASILWDLFFTPQGSAVAVTAHFGGYLFGAGVSLTLLATGLLKREPFDLFSIAKHAKRRREFRELTSKGNRPWVHQAGLGADAQGAAPDPALLQRRAALTDLVARRDAPGATRVYRELVNAHGRDAALFARDVQLDLANLVFAEGDRELAAIAYDAFLARHPRDSEAPRVSLMLGLIHARYLNDPVRAKALLAEAKAGVTATDQRALAEELLAELG